MNGDYTYNTSLRTYNLPSSEVPRFSEQLLWPYIVWVVCFACFHSHRQTQTVSSARLATTQDTIRETSCPASGLSVGIRSRVSNCKHCDYIAHSAKNLGGAFSGVISKYSLCNNNSLDLHAVLFCVVYVFCSKKSCSKTHTSAVVENWKYWKYLKTTTTPTKKNWATH